MAGIRVGGTAILPPPCSPPWGAYQDVGAPFPDSSEVWMACATDSPGIPTQITDFTDGGITDLDQIYNPVLSPDGSKVLFEGHSPTTGYPEIWVSSSTPGSTATKIVSDASNYCQYPNWGPDSDTFIYKVGAGGALIGGTIYKDTVSAVGSPTALVTAAGGYSPFRAMFSFDGSRIAFIWDKDAGAGCELRVMDDDGTNVSILDNTLVGPMLNDPPGMSWANSMNTICYSDAQTAAAIYVINDDGTGQVQVNANGFAAGAAGYISQYAWAPNDGFIVMTANVGSGFQLTRAELDGSTTSQLLAASGGQVAANRTYYKVALVGGNRIWFISRTASTDGFGAVASTALDGSDFRTDFDSTLGPGDYVVPFTGGDGWYFN